MPTARVVDRVIDLAGGRIEAEGEPCDGLIDTAYGVGFRTVILEA